MTQTNQKRRRGSVAIPVIVAGGISSMLLAFSMTPTFAALAATIQNSTNTAGTGTLVMEERNSAGTVTCTSTDGGSVATNSATCATINKYGGSMVMVPGSAVSTDITIKNTGSVAASSFSVTGGTCTQSANGTVNGTATDLCGKLNVVVKSGTTTIYSGTAAGFTTTTDILNKLSTTSVAAGASIPVNISVTLDPSAGNAYQGLKASQAITWAFGA
jgi:hypothetical protein